jgi:hypothetical protein
MNLAVLGAASRLGELVNLFALEVPLSQFQDSFPDRRVSEPRPYIDSDDREEICKITGGAGLVLNRLPESADSWIRDEAMYPFLLELVPYAERYFPGRIKF